MGIAMSLMLGLALPAGAQQRPGDGVPPPPPGMPLRPPPGMPPPPGMRPPPPRLDPVPAAAPANLPAPVLLAPASAAGPEPVVDGGATSPAVSAPEPAAHRQALTATMPARIAPTPARASASANPSPRPLPWLLLLALAGALLAWWASLRRSRQLREEAERLVRQQRFLKSAHSHLRQKSEQLQQLSMHDPLTGTLNRQAFAAELRERIDHLAKYNQPLSLIVFDLDHFKTINDGHGHLVGDAALALVVGVVREHLVSDDLFGRFGGDEFMIACAGQGAAHAAALAERLRAAVAERAPQAQPPIPGLTLSLGVAQADPDHGYHSDELFARADAALYAAKQGGRNRVVADAPAGAVAGAIRRHL